MRKTILCGILISVLSICLLVLNANADGIGSGKGGSCPIVPEPISYLLIFAGGASLAGLRRWKNKRNTKFRDGNHRR